MVWNSTEFPGFNWKIPAVHPNWSPSLAPLPWLRKRNPQSGFPPAPAAKCAWLWRAMHRRARRISWPRSCWQRWVMRWDEKMMGVGAIIPLVISVISWIRFFFSSWGQKGWFLRGSLRQAAWLWTPSHPVFVQKSTAVWERNFQLFPHRRKLASNWSGPWPLLTLGLFGSWDVDKQELKLFGDHRTLWHHAQICRERGLYQMKQPQAPVVTMRPRSSTSQWKGSSQSLTHKAAFAPCRTKVGTKWSWFLFWSKVHG